MFILNEKNSIANHYLAEIRDVHQQHDRLRFRNNLERLGEIMAYEISGKMPFAQLAVKTPLGTAHEQVMAEQPVLVSILRAGLPFFRGFTHIFDKADAGFIGAFRAPHAEDEAEAEEINIQMNYVAVPNIEGRQLIIIDPMLATGKSIIKCLNTLLAHGKPAHIHMVSVIAAPEGIAHIQRNVQQEYSIWTCALDEKLDKHSYIVPGLGDAGDLAFGPKN